MFSRRLLAGLVIVFAGVGLSAPAVAQKKEDKKKKETPPAKKGVTLQWKFEKDKEFYQEMTTKTDQTMTVMNNKVTQTQKQTFVFSWKPLDQPGTDKWKIEQKIVGVAMDIDIGGSKIQYDSKKDNPQNPLAEFFKALEGAAFKVTLNTKTLKVEDIEGRKAFVDKLVGANPQMKPLLEVILSDKALKDMAEPTFAVVPTKPVTVGDSWKRETELDMGPIGKYKNVYTYTYEGPEGKDSKLHRIKVDTSLTYTAPADNTDSRGLPFKIKSASLKSSDATGTIIFNADLGRVESSKMGLKLSGKLQIEIGGQTTTVELNQSQTSTVETKSTNPIPAKS
jgi:hypothetical protein